MKNPKSELKTIMDLEKLNTNNAEGCLACGRKFNLGEIAVPARGFWDGVKYIHEDEAVFDPKTSSYYERKCYETMR